MHKLSDEVARKFIDTISLDDWEVDTDSGWQSISHVNKTVVYDEWEIVTSSGKSFTGADTHILFDGVGNEIYLKDCRPGDIILTRDGPETVAKVGPNGNASNMYDLTVDSEDHRYWTGGLLSHNSTVTAAYLCWYARFNKNKTAAVLANKMSIAREIFSRVQFMYEELPSWLQLGVNEWNKTSFILENGTRCFCAASSPSAVRGQSINLLLCDEFAHLSSNLADEFIASVFPTLSSGKTTKLILISTPKGKNHFYKMWTEAERGINDFVPVEGKWHEHPDRDQAWADGMLGQLGEVKYAQEISCEFTGSSYTLVKGSSIDSLPFKKPTILIPAHNNNGLHQFEPPKPNHSYVTLVDTARGLDLDASAFTVIDITKMPYEVVLTYKDPSISTLVYPELIMNTAMKYNNSFVFIESNDLGQEVANTLYYDLEYENVYMSNRDDLKEGGGVKYSPGCRTTSKTKSIGCNQIKNIIENGELVVNDFRIIDELSTFVRRGRSYAAEDGKHDDLAMTLVMFGYLTTTPVFQELFDFSLRQRLVRKQLETLEEQMLPIGFVSRGDSFVEEVIVDRKGENLWLGNANIDQFMKMFG